VRLVSVMRDRIRRACLLALLTTVLAPFWNPQGAFACSCLPYAPEYRYPRADAVFRGQVLSVEHVKEAYYEPQLRGARLLVDHVWKGDLPPIARIKYDVASVAMCGGAVPFDVGKDFIVYAERYPGKEGYSVGGCSRSLPIEFAEADYQFLPPEPSVATPARRFEPVALLAIGFLLLLRKEIIVARRDGQR
jgi:hypothetical protein